MLQDAKIENSIILALECSGNAASAALMVDGKITGFQEYKARYGHAETLIGLVDKTVHIASIPLANITHIAAGCGPGSFTGLRVCLSAAKGYQLATGAKPLGISGLSALAYQAAAQNKTAGRNRCLFGYPQGKDRSAAQLLYSAQLLYFASRLDRPARIDRLSPAALLRLLIDTL